MIWESLWADSVCGGAGVEAVAPEGIGHDPVPAQSGRDLVGTEPAHRPDLVETGTLSFRDAAVASDETLDRAVQQLISLLVMPGAARLYGPGQRHAPGRLT